MTPPPTPFTPAGTVSPTAPLPPRLRDVAWCLAQGLSAKETAQRLSAPLSTVRTYTARLYARLGIHNRVQLVHKLVELGQWPPP